MKLGILQEEQGEFDKALESYRTIKREYPESAEGRNIVKYITRVETKMP
jgi:hypothetical protein